MWVIKSVIKRFHHLVGKYFRLWPLLWLHGEQVEMTMMMMVRHVFENFQLINKFLKMAESNAASSASSFVEGSEDFKW